MVKKPFSQENLNEIFKRSPLKPDRVNSRESGWLEFKEFSVGPVSRNIFVRVRHLQMQRAAKGAQ